MADISRANWTYETAAHLLNRAGFGHNGAVARGTGEATHVRSLYLPLSREPADFIEDLFPRRAASIPRKTEDTSRMVVRRWTKRMLRANRRRTVQEKMVLFLHGHLVSQVSVVGNPEHLDRQLALYRRYATGDYRELLKRTNIDNAMLIYLNGDENRFPSINENYGRELLELFSMGPFDFAGERNYSQTDVSEAARILSGWGAQSAGEGTGVGLFTPVSHDPGTKTVFTPDPGSTPLQNPANEFSLGNLADLEHETLIDRIFDHVDTEGKSSVARFMTRKLWKFFAYDPEVDAGTPRGDLVMIDELAEIFRNGSSEDPPWSLAALLKAMFLREEFYSDPAKTTTVQSPAAFVITSARKLAGSIPTTRNENFGREDDHRSREMGQILLDPPNVAGWPGNSFWFSAENNLSRLSFARDLAERDKKGSKELGINIKRVLRWIPENPTREVIVDTFLKLLGPVSVEPANRDAMIAWLGPDDSVIDLGSKNSDFVRERIRGLIHIILSLPEIHVG